MARVWVTGSSSGLGRALALELNRRGHEVWVTARSSDALESLKAEALEPARIQVAEGDVTDPARMAEIVDQMEAAGGVDIAVLNAGIYIPVDGTRPDLKAMHTTFDVNLKGTANCVVPLIEAMRPRRAGHIAMVASVAGYSGLPMATAYGATKAGMINFAEALRFDTDRLGIKLQLINPGFVDTPATAENPFEMPFLMKVEDAATRIADGLKSNSFEITFPRRFTYQLKFMRLLPYWLYHPLVSRATGWKNKPLDVQTPSDGA